MEVYIDILSLLFSIILILLLIIYILLGQSGLGKSTLINSLFMTDLYEDTVYNASPQRQPRTTEVRYKQSLVTVCMH